MKPTADTQPAFNPKLLDFFFGVGLVLLINGAGRPHRPETLQLASLGLAVILTVLWLLWRHRRGKATAIIFATIALASYIATDSLMSVVCQWVALIVLELSLPQIAGYLYGTVLIATTAAIHLLSDSEPSRVFGESLAVLVIVVAGISFARLMKNAESLDRQRRAMIAELSAANQALERNLRDSRDLVLSRERERVATSLHDGLGHHLTTIGFSLDFADRMVERDPVRARAEVGQARAAVSAALADMRATVRAMTPVELADGSISLVLAKLARSFEGTGLVVSFTSSEPSELSEALNQLLLRFTQEALTNVIRHAGADHVVITLSGERLSIADNGHGGNAEPGYGLSSLSRRAREAGATVSVTPHGGVAGGFLLTLELPKVAP